MINNYHLLYFKDVVELKNFSKAAKKNLISPSAISQAIQSLENKIQFKLFHHQKNKFALTSEGKSFYQKTIDFLEELEKFQKEIEKKHNNYKGKILFATQQSFASLLLPELLSKAKEKFPNIDPHFKMGLTKDVRDLVVKEKVDFGICLNNVKFVGTEHVNIFKGKFVCIKKKNTKELNFITTEETKEVKYLKASYKKYYKKQLPVRMVVGSWGVIAKLALKGLGIAMIPDYYLWQLERKDYSLHKLSFPLPQYEVNAYYLKKKSVEKKTHDFIDLIAKVAREIKASTIF